MTRNPESQGVMQRRASVIMRVQSGLLTATDAARELGVSRKTYYQWEKRALSALGQALKNREGGRPSRPVDSEKERLKKRVEDLEAQDRVRSQVERIREMLKGAETSAGKK